MNLLLLVTLVRATACVCALSLFTAVRVKQSFLECLQDWVVVHCTYINWDVLIIIVIVMLSPCILIWASVVFNYKWSSNLIPYLEYAILLCYTMSYSNPITLLL